MVDQGNEDGGLWFGKRKAFWGKKEEKEVCVVEEGVGRMARMLGGALGAGAWGGIWGLLPGGDLRGQSGVHRTAQMS